MNSTSKISEPTRYDEQGNESPTGLLVFYSDWLELKQRAEHAESHNEPQWVSVKEGLPEVKARVLVAFSTNDYEIVVREGFYDDGPWKIQEYGWLYHPHVTHWMPLPAAPAQGKE